MIISTYTDDKNVPGCNSGTVQVYVLHSDLIQTWLKREAESVLKSSYFQGSSKLKRKRYIYVGQGWILALSEVSFIFINTSKQDKNNYIPLTLFQRFMLLLLFITNKGGDGTCFNLVLKLQMISSIFQKLKGVQLVLTAHVHIKGIHNHPSWSLTQIFFLFMISLGFFDTVNIIRVSAIKVLQ